MTEDNIIIKPQTIVDMALPLNGSIHNVKITIKNHGEESVISIGDRDIFFDKDGNFSGSGFNLKNSKEIKTDTEIKTKGFDNEKRVVR